jgi:hypothetical protein
MIGIGQIMWIKKTEHACNLSPQSTYMGGAITDENNTKVMLSLYMPFTFSYLLMYYSIY